MPTATLNVLTRMAAQRREQRCTPWALGWCSCQLETLSQPVAYSSARDCLLSRGHILQPAWAQRVSHRAPASTCACARRYWQTKQLHNCVPQASCMPAAVVAGPGNCLKQACTNCIVKPLHALHKYVHTLLNKGHNTAQHNTAQHKLTRHI